jgi:RNA polymerase sigma-70 factor (ECF subfamily)
MYTLAEEFALPYREAVHFPTAFAMVSRPTPINIEQWVKDIGRRALVMAEIAIKDRDVAQDLVQDSLLAFISRYTDKPTEAWTPLFYTILRSQIMDWKRRQARRGKWLTWFKSNDDNEEDDYDDPFTNIATEIDSNPATLLANADDLSTVQQVLSALPARQQQAFLLRSWEGLDITATAKIMECSESSVKTHHSRALLALRSGITAANTPFQESSA